VVATFYHARMLPRTATQESAGGSLPRDLAKSCGSFLVRRHCSTVACVFSFFLFNLYLLDRGFRERCSRECCSSSEHWWTDRTLPAGIFAQRFGLRRSLLFCMTLVPALFCLRALATSQQLQIGLGFVGGLALSMWLCAFLRQWRD